MSIIHQALKKAAAEGQVPHSSSTLIKRNPARSFSPKLTLSFSLFVLFLFFYVIFFNQHWNSVSSFFKIKRANKSESIFYSPRQQGVQSSSENRLQLDSDSEISQRGEAALAEGIVLYTQGKMELSKERFTKVVSLLPRSAVAHNNLGLVLRNQGKIEEAIQHYQKAIELDPNYAEAHNNVGMAYDQRGSIDQAGNYYETAIHFKPEAPEFHLNYATWLERKGDFGKARQEYQTFLNLESNIVRNGSAKNQQIESIALVTARLMELKGF